MDKNFNIYHIKSTYTFCWDEKFVFNGERHSAWEIVFVESGKVCVSEDDKVYVLEQDNMVFHAPNEFHKIRSYGGSCPVVKVLSFEVDGIIPEQLKNGVFTLDFSEKHEFLQTFDKAQKYFYAKDCGPYDKMEVICRLSAFLICMGQKNSQEMFYNSASALAYRNLVLSMKNNVDKNLSVSDIAKSNFVSVSYMKFLFGKYAGISPKKYFIDLRIWRVNQLLCQGFSVSEVAEKMNFSSDNYLSSFYKKQTGMSPKKFVRFYKT